MARKLTPKQEKLADIMIDNALQKNKTKTQGELLKEAGYSKASMINPHQILESPNLQAELQIRTAKTIKALEKERNRAIGLLEKKAPKAPFNHLVNGIDIFTKNIQLLSGKATENKAIQIQISEHIATKNQ